MKDSLAKEKILKAIDTAIELNSFSISNVKYPSPYKDKEDDLAIIFAENFTKANGKFIYCSGENDFQSKLKTLTEYRQWDSITCYKEQMHNYLSNIEIKNTLFENSETSVIGISLCENLIARNGSVVLSSTQSIEDKLLNIPKIFIILAFTSQVVNDLQTSFEQIAVKHNNSFPKTILTLTATECLKNDIDEFYIFLIEDEGV